MSRQDRYGRRVPARVAIPGVAAGPNGANGAIAEAGRLLQENRTQKAERLLRKILKAEPSNAEALHLAGVARYRGGKAKQARQLVERAVRIVPDDPSFRVTLAGILEEAGETSRAVVEYERAVELDPLDAAAWFALANAWKQTGHLEAAVDCFGKVLEIAPNDAPALFNMGNALKALGRLEAAVEAYRLALAARPGFTPVYKNLGTTLTELGRTAEAFEFLRAGAQITFASDGFDEAELRHPLMSSKAKLQHDAEQIEYLVSHGKLDEGYTEYAARYCRLIASVPDSVGPTKSFELPKDERRAIAKAYNRLVYLNEAPRCDGPAVNPGIDEQAIERAYNASRPEIVYFDDFLTDAALQGLREFCLESTIWYARYENGYLGAMLGDGFASPLLAQIVDELPQKLPAIFGGHKLRQAWAFKYDSHLSGINLHADFAAVNVNFWITPDDALESPEEGGLTVWDKEAPLDWDFDKYNTDEPKMRRFLEESGARAVSVPYRQNRALVFNSDLFHETDRIAFKPGYENRRINITLLYGDRRSG